MALVNMQMSAEEAKEQCEPMPADMPRYPYGLELSLDDDALAKLGITQPPAVGSTMTITAVVKVTSASAYETEGSEAEISSRWQITDMEVGASPQASTSASQATKLYGG